MWPIKILYILLLTVTTFSCSNVQSLDLDIDDIGNCPVPLFEPIDIDIGFYYSGKLKTFKIIKQVQNSSSNLSRVQKIQLGKANIVLYDYIFSTVFDKVTLIDNFRKGSNYQRNIDLVIAPEVDSFFYDLSDNHISVDLTYAVNLWFPDGKQIAVWKIQGIEDANTSLFSNESESLVHTAQMAMRQVAAKFMVGFCKQIEMKQLFPTQCYQ